MFHLCLILPLYSCPWNSCFIHFFVIPLSSNTERKVMELKVWIFPRPRHWQPLVERYVNLLLVPECLGFYLELQTPLNLWKMIWLFNINLFFNESINDENENIPFSFHEFYVHCLRWYSCLSSGEANFNFVYPFLQFKQNHAYHFRIRSNSFKT